MIQQFINDLQLPLSKERLEAYRPDQGSDLAMVVNYFWNLRLCEALYPTLNAVEIALRNSINSALNNYYNNEYWFEGEWTNNSLLVESTQYTQIEDARSKLRKRNSEENPGRIVAELSFGFWVGLLNRPYEEKIWSLNDYALLRIVFPAARRRDRKRSLLRDRFAVINDLRNRVFHYEPIGYRKTLGQEHANILQAIGWISPVMRDSIKLYDRFPDVYNTGREQVEADIKQYLGI